MTNLEIVIRDAVASNIFTETQIEGYLSEGDLPLKTYRSWRNAGFIVKKGEQARLKTRLWQQCKPKKNSKDKDDKNENFILVPTYLFTSDQVVPVREG